MGIELNMLSIGLGGIVINIVMRLFVGNKDNFFELFVFFKGMRL